MKTYRAFVGLMLNMLLVACSFGTGQATSTTHSADNGDSVEMGLPTVPDGLTGPEERAGYVMLHFWDKLEPTDTVKSLNEDFVEQNFANFVSLFPIGSEDARKAGIEALMTRMRACPAAYNMMVKTARKYLYDPNSPMYNEGYYETFLQVVEGDETLSTEEYARVATELVWVGKNREGTIASDFRYKRSDGKMMTLLTTPVKRWMVLVLYDPECDTCHEIVGELGKNEKLNELISSGEMEVLAINFIGERKNGIVEIPSNWMNGLDMSGIEDNEIYVVRATPALYVLDGEHRVMVKDCQPETLLQILGRM